MLYLLNMPDKSATPAQTNNDLPSKKFPYSEKDKNRLVDYRFYRMLFDGAHFDAFKIRIQSKDFNDAYARIRYLYVNFPGMISKIVADMLFGEPVKIQAKDPKTQAWLEDFWRENNLDMLFYESALTNSAEGDALVKLRTGKRGAKDKENTVLLEPVPPAIYFPHVDIFNVTGEPAVKELAWKFSIDK